MKNKLLLPLFFIPLILVGCGNDEPSGGGEENKSLTSIEVTTLPCKTTYTINESVDMAGAVITAKFSDNTTSDVTSEVEVSHPKFELPQYYTVTVTYTYESVSKSTTFTVTVKELISFTVDTSTIPTGDFNNESYYDKFTSCFAYNDKNYIQSLNVTGFAQVNSKKVTTEEGELTITSLIIGSQKQNGKMNFTCSNKLLSLSISAHPQYSAYYDVKSGEYKKSSDPKNAIKVNNEEWVLRDSETGEGSFDLVSRTFEINSETFSLSANAAERVCIRSLTFTFEI